MKPTDESTGPPTYLPGSEPSLFSTMNDSYDTLRVHLRDDPARITLAVYDRLAQCQE